MQKEKRNEKTLRKMVGMLVVAASIVSMVSVQDVSASQTTQTSYETMEEPILQEDMSDDELVEGIIAESISTTIGNTVSCCSNNGFVKGDGVRLRKKPSTTATILELMESGEKVLINQTKSKPQNGKWYFVQRKQTGTWGWVKGTYIIHL